MLRVSGQGGPIVCAPCQAAAQRGGALRFQGLGSEASNPIAHNIILFGAIGVAIWTLGNWMASQPSRSRR